MYCSIDEAWSNNNTMKELNKRYNSHNKLSQPNDALSKTYNVKNQLSDQNNNIDSYFDDILENDSISSPKVILKKKIKKKDNKEKDNKEKDNKDYNELVNKVLSCPKCRKLIMIKLGIRNKNRVNIVNQYLTDDNKELIILILIGLIIMVLLDIFIRISRSIK